MSTYYTSKYSGEQIDEAVKKIMDGEMTGDYADRQLSNLDTPQGALANLGAGVRPNLLDNAIFIGGGSQQGGGQLPVNQRGQTSYVDGNVIDRWKLSGNGGKSLTIASDGIILTSTADYGLYFTQNLEQSVIEACLGEKVTASVLSVGQNTAQVNLNLYVDNTWKDYMSIQEGLSTKQFTIPLTANSFYINFGAGTSGTCKLIAVKLEFGDTQTLAYQDDTGAWQLLPQPESDYATQLVKCQRYLAAMENHAIVRSAYVSTNFVDFLVPIPVSFRVLPTIQSAEKLVLITYPDGVNVSGVTWSIATKSSASVRLRASKPNILSEGTDFSVYTDSGATFFSAEL